MSASSTISASSTFPAIGTIAKLALAAAVLSLAACASTGGAPGAARHAAAQGEPDKLVRVDYERVAQIQYLARKRNVEVHWVNPPLLDGAN